MKSNDEKMSESRRATVSAMSRTLDREIQNLQIHAFNLGEKAYYADACLVATITANVDNDKLTDAEFRAFVRNSVVGHKK